MNWKIDDQVTCWDLVKMVKKIHPREEDISEGDLIDRIKRFGVYIFQEILLSDLLRGRYELDKELMEEYVEESVDTQPPIIVTERFSGKHDIVDGNHRVEAQAKRGHDTIVGFVPLEETKIEDDEDEVEED